MTRTLVRCAGVLVLAAVIVGPSAHARSPHAPEPARPAYGHTTNEWLMMGRNCGADMTAG